MSKIKTLRRVMFPYGMERNKDGSWTLFNREYSPVGVVQGGYYEWNDERHKVRIKGISKSDMKKLDCSGAGNSDRIYFYNDGSAPEQSSEAMASYLEKMAILLRAKA